MNHFEQGIEFFKKLNADLRERKRMAVAATPAPKVQAEPADPGEALRSYFKSQRNDAARRLGVRR